jgi:acyl-CoA reductase-like NAD-dependent aldehyde dehydrogenase
MPSQIHMMKTLTLDNARLVIKNPSTGETLKDLVCDTQETVEKKVALSAKLHANKDDQLPLALRISILEDVLQQMQTDREDLALLIALEGGKPLQDALVEAERAAFGIKLAIAHMLSQGSQTTPINTFSVQTEHLLSIHHEPIGPVIAVSAFNHPLNLVTHQLVSAFAAGCPCVIKPAADTPLCCIKLVEMFARANTPPGWVDYVLTQDNGMAETLVTDPRFAFFSFIGSARVGWYLRSKLPPGTRCALEHGGVAPAFVDETADLTSAIATLVKGGYYHAGQVCVSTQRIFIAKSIYGDFVERFCAAVRGLQVGDATNINTQIGPLIRQNEVTRVKQWISESVAMGGRLLIGGEVLSGQFCAPAVIANAPRDAIINQNEVFGPVCSLMAYEDLRQEINKINSEAYSFHSAIFSDSNETIQQCYKHLDTGCLMVNEHTAFRHDAMTFAGLKQSGLGAGGMPKSIHHMQVEKLLINNTHLGQALRT